MTREDLGLTVLYDFIDIEQEASLILFIFDEWKKAKPFTGDGGLGREFIWRWGYAYDPEDTNWIRNIPPILCVDKIPEFNSVTVNGYKPGQFIMHHFDNMSFGEPISILSLNVESTMRFTHPDHPSFDVELPARSLLEMRGPIRREWLHETLPLADGPNRYSIVYRKKII